MEIEIGARLYGVLQAMVRALELTSKCNRKPLESREQGPTCCDVMFYKEFSGEHQKLVKLVVRRSEHYGQMWI